MRLASQLIKPVIFMIRELKFRYELLNKDNLHLGTLDSTGGSVTFNGLAESIKRTARFSIRESELKDVDYLNDRIRPVISLNGIEYPMGVFLIPSPTRIKRTGGVYRNIEGYDVTQIMLEDKVTDRFMVKEGLNYVTAIIQIINSANIYRVSIPSSDNVLVRDREFEIGTSKLKIANELLKEINYNQLWTDRHGTVRSEKYVLPNNIEMSFRYESGDKNEFILSDSFSEDIDLFNIPNTFVVLATNAEREAITAKYVNNNPSSPTSVSRRRRTIVDYREVSDIANKEVLEEYVKRIAYNASNIYSNVEFDTIINPMHEYLDGIYLYDKVLGIDSKYVETGWEIDMSIGGRMKHKARKVVLI